MASSMETARTFMDLTVSQTLHNFTHTHFVLPHGTFSLSNTPFSYDSLVLGLV